MRGSNAPSLGVRYQFKIGKSLRTRSSAPRDLLALKFTHIPEKAHLASPGTLSRSADTCAVQLPTRDGDAAVHFSGSRRNVRPDSNVSDFMLVFAHGKMWLERTTDLFYGIRPVDGGGKRRTPPGGDGAEDDDDVMRDPDSWMPHASTDPESSSPITPEDDIIMRDRPPAAAAPPARTGGKSTPAAAPPMARSKRVSAGKVNSVKVAPEAAQVTTAAKSVATKSVAMKGLSNASGPAGKRRNEDDENDDDENDVSSSEEDDSDDSDSDSDSDSADYTDRSSDEED